MAIYTLHIFNRAGACLYYREWSRPVPPTDQRQDNKLMFGFLFSLKQLVQKMSPKKGGGFYACSTSAYKLNYHETASGLRFVMTTDLAGAAAAPARAAPDSRSAHGSPRQASHASEPRVNPRGAQPATCASHCGTIIYSHIFVECLVKNPLWKPDDEISCPLFVQNLERYVASLPFS